MRPSLNDSTVSVLPLDNFGAKVDSGAGSSESPTTRLHVAASGTTGAILVNLIDGDVS